MSIQTTQSLSQDHLLSSVIDSLIHGYHTNTHSKQNHHDECVLVTATISNTLCTLINGLDGGLKVNKMLQET